ncbi:MAG: hypothetical protein ACOX8F_11625 [Sakamotonia sp.]|jgi:hypothetical protein
MKKIWVCGLAAAMSAAVTVPAFAGTWKQDLSRPAVQDGTSGWWYQNDDGTYPANGWFWLDGDQNGVAESYRFDGNGWMFASSVVDGFEVNENGAWTVDGVVQTKYAEPGSTGNSGETESPAAGAGMTDEEAYEAIISLKETYPEGKKWTNENTFRRNFSIGAGCAGFAYMVQDTLYGSSASYEVHDRLDREALRVGDHIRMYNNQGGEHSVIILTIGKDFVTVAEGNFNSSIHWGRRISMDDLEEAFIYRETVSR